MAYEFPDAAELEAGVSAIFRKGPDVPEDSSLTASQIRHAEPAELRQLAIHIAMTFFESPRVEARLGSTEELLTEAEKVRAYLWDGTLPKT